MSSPQNSGKKSQLLSMSSPQNGGEIITFKYVVATKRWKKSQLLRKKMKIHEKTWKNRVRLKQKILNLEKNIAYDYLNGGKFYRLASKSNRGRTNVTIKKSLYIRPDQPR